MAVSIWDKPAELKLTPIPFEAMLMATQAKDKAYKQNVDKIDAYADAILGYKALPGDDTEYLKQSRETLNNLVSSSVGKVDLTNPTIARDFISKARSIAQDPKLVRNQAYLTHVQKEQERLSKFKDEKDATYMSQSFKFNKDLNQYVTPGSGGGDKYNATNIVGGVKGVNTNNEKEPYFNNMPSLKFETPKQAGDYYYSITTDGINMNRLDTQSVNALRDYANSDGGRQELSDYNMILETNPKALLNKKGEITKPEEYLYQSLARTAMERYGVSVTSDYTNALNLGVKDQKDNPYLAGMTEPTQFDPYMKINSPFGDVTPDEIKWTDKGNPMVKSGYVAPISGAIGQDAPGVQEGDPQDIAEKKRLEEKALVKQKNIIRQAELFRFNDPNLKDKSIKEIYTLMEQAHKNAAGSFNAITYPQLDNTQVAGRILGSLANKNLHLISSAGEGGDFDLNGIADKLGITTVEVQKAIHDKAVAGGAKFVPLNASGKPGYLVQLTSGNGTTADVIVPISNEANTIFDKFNYAFEAYKSGKTGVNKNAIIIPGDEGVYTGLETHVDPNNPNNLIPEWVVGRVQSIKETNTFLKENNLTKDQAIKLGVSFTPTGHLVVKDIPQLIKQTSDEFINSPYMKGYFNNQPKNTPTFR